MNLRVRDIASLILICSMLQQIFASSITDIEDLLKPERVRKISPETGGYSVLNSQVEYGNNILIKILGDNGITISCFYSRLSDTKWQKESYISSSKENIRVKNIFEPITVTPDKGNKFSIVFYEVLPACEDYIKNFVGL